MKPVITAALVLILVACAKTETPAPTGTAVADTAARPTANDTTAPVAAEKTYTMNGVLVSRDLAKNTVNIDNDDVPGAMAPMKMDYELRGGANVDALPPDGTRVTMTLHEQDGTYWVSDVKPLP